MKVTHYLPLAAACLMMVGCGTGKQKAEMTAGIQLANLDTTALPGSSFYQYARGGWIESHPLSPEYSQYGSFTELAENNRKHYCFWFPDASFFYCFPFTFPQHLWFVFI